MNKLPLDLDELCKYSKEQIDYIKKLKESLPILSSQDLEEMNITTKKDNDVYKLIIENDKYQWIRK
jgi:hypothetical protein